MGWRHGGSPHLKKFQVQKICWKISHLDFLGSRQQGQTIQVEYYSSLLVQMKDVWKEKCHEVTNGVCCCTTMPKLTRHLQPRRNWPTWASSVLITHPILRTWPRRTTTCSLD